MTEVLEPPTHTGHAVVRFSAGLHAALDQVSGTPAWSMSEDEQREVLVGLASARARLEELELRVLAAAERNDVGADSGATSTAAWLADATTRCSASCSREVHLALALDEEFDATRRALSAGSIDTERAAVIVEAVRALTAEYDDLPAGTHEEAEAHLLALAARYDAPTLRRLGKRLFEVVCPESADAVEGQKLAAEEARARRLAYLSLRDNGDGTTEGRLRLPTLHAAVLKKALGALTAPQRLGDARLDPETGKVLAHSTLMGHGLMQLLEHHLDLDAMPGSHGTPFTLVVTIGLDALRTGLGVAAVETGARISAGEARRLACTAGLIPMVLGGDSQPLDLGRERRFFSRYQRRALHETYRGCAATNCDRPSAWCDVHHQEPWSRGGRTDLRDGIPLCAPHHHMADHPDTWDMTRLPGGGVRFRRRT